MVKVLQRISQLELKQVLYRFHINVQCGRQCMYVFMNTYADNISRKYIHVCMYVCMYVCMFYVCMCTYRYLHVHELYTCTCISYVVFYRW